WPGFRLRESVGRSRPPNRRQTCCHMDRLLATEALVVELLLVASLVAIAVRRLRVPYTVALVIAGLLITFQRPIRFELTPELIPRLIFEAAFHVDAYPIRSRW